MKTTPRGERIGGGEKAKRETERSIVKRGETDIEGKIKRRKKNRKEGM